MRLKKVVMTALVGCAGFVVMAASGLAEQATEKAKPAMAEQAKPAPEMAQKCQAMMAERDKMMAEMKAADLRLDDLVAKMNSAPGPDKATATAAVVNELVTQRRTMRDGMQKGQQAMLGHMMAHMQTGKDSMAMCPMMKMKHEGDTK
jgi:hypothetical protein